MKKIKGIVDRFEHNKAIIRADGEELALPKSIVDEEIGKEIFITVLTEEEEKMSSSEVAEALLVKALQGE